ncbi:MAG: hypothetical protein U1F10_00485 [Burkholderiales bacterium]
MDENSILTTSNDTSISVETFDPLAPAWHNDWGTAPPFSSVD